MPNSDAAAEPPAPGKSGLGRDPMSRGGSRQGKHFRGSTYGGQRGPDGSTSVAAAPPRPPTTVGEAIQFGEINKPPGGPLAFGPNGVFSRNRDAKRRKPSISPSHSTSNMFAMLKSDAAAEPPALGIESSRPSSHKPSADFTQTGVPEPHQRKKLTLLPRTIPEPHQQKKLTLLPRTIPEPQQPTKLTLLPRTIPEPQQPTKLTLLPRTIPEPQQQKKLTLLPRSIPELQQHKKLTLLPRTIPEPHQRKKLKLLPRSIPVPGDFKVEEESAALSKVSEDDGEPYLTEDQANAKIEKDVKGFWAIRDLEEANSYFPALPAAFKAKLVDKLVGSALERKETDAKLVAELFARAVDKNDCPVSLLEEGLASQIEFIADIAIDFPAAYKLMAILLKGSKLPKSRVEGLADKIVVEDNPAVHPKDRLLEEYEKLDSS